MKDVIKSGVRKKVAVKLLEKRVPRSAGPSAKGKGPGVKSAAKPGAKPSAKHSFRLEPQLLRSIHEQMVKARVFEERLIRMYKQNDGYFWIGGPGEESFNVPLGMQVKKGEGKDHDFLHLHYRSSAILLTMGMDPMSGFRQMKNTVTDPHSAGRNFVNHYSMRRLNVVPIASTIETQYLTSIGTAIAQRAHGGDSITIVNGGDAGSAEGDFASCLVWASRPGKELPLLIIVTNNEWGISTPASTQHGEKCIADRGKAFGMKTLLINGLDVEESWFALQEAMQYIRKERKPVLLEARVSRLYGHSSATGANYITEETDCLTEFEKKLEAGGILSRKKMDELRERYTQEFLELSQQAKSEPMPDPATIYDHTYQGQKGRYW